MLLGALHVLFSSDLSDNKEMPLLWQRVLSVAGRFTRVAFSDM